jgi:hypothetical protein
MLPRRVTHWVQWCCGRGRICNRMPAVTRKADLKSDIAVVLPHSGPPGVAKPVKFLLMVSRESVGTVHKMARFLASRRVRPRVLCGFLRGRRTVAGHHFADSRGRGRYFPERPYSLRSKYRRAPCAINDPSGAVWSINGAALFNQPWRWTLWATRACLRPNQVPGLFHAPSADLTRKPAQRAIPLPRAERYTREGYRPPRSA